MKLGLIVALIGTVASSSFIANAVELRNDGNELLDACKEFIAGANDRNFNAFKGGKCVSYVRGVSDTVFFYRSVLKKDERFCEPAGVTNGQRVRIVVKYLEDNPKMLNRSDMVLIWNALMDAYPCT